MAVEAERLFCPKAEDNTISCLANLKLQIECTSRSWKKLNNLIIFRWGFLWVTKPSNAPDLIGSLPISTYISRPPVMDINLPISKKSLEIFFSDYISFATKYKCLEWMDPSVIILIVQIKKKKEKSKTSRFRIAWGWNVWVT